MASSFGFSDSHRSFDDIDVGLVRWPIKDINFILVLIVFLSLSTAEKMFSPWNYTFYRGKSLLSEEKTLFRGIILFSAELNFSPWNYTFHRGKKPFLRGENFISRNYTFLRGIILRGIKFSPRRKVFFPRWKV